MPWLGYMVNCCTIHTDAILRDLGLAGLCISKLPACAMLVIHEKFCCLSWNSWAQRPAPQTECFGRR